MNTFVIIFLSLGVIALVIFIASKNQKDKKDLEKSLNEPSNPKMKKESDTNQDDGDKI